MVTEVTDADFEAEVVGADLPVLVEFTADWCPPCRQMAPVLKALASEEGERLKVVQLDVDHNPLTTNAYKVLSMPTFLVFRDGEPVKSMVGARAKRRCWRSCPTCCRRARRAVDDRPDTRKSPGQLRPGDFLAYICLFVTSRRMRSRRSSVSTVYPGGSGIVKHRISGR
ncbi:hypothetical protein SUDANB52_02434 [Streptomyces sp. SudanB52_2052]